MRQFQNDEEYFQQWEWFLKLEADAERSRLASRRASRSERGMPARVIESRGDTLMHMVVADHRTGLGGRTILTFTKRQQQQVLPWNRFRVGAPVVASNEESFHEVGNGVVTARSGTSIDVVFDDWPEAKFFRLELSSDEVTRRRLSAAMRQAAEGRARLSQWRNLLIGDREPEFYPLRDVGQIESRLSQTRLNPSQKQAIVHALSANDFAIIHGPPGTGKTTTVAELIRQACERGDKVLACAPSNTGVDNLLEKLISLGVDAVRIGHPARVLENLQQHTLDALVDSDPGMRVVRDMQREADRILDRAGKWTRGRPVPGARDDFRAEAKRLRSDARLLEQSIVDSKLDSADVICATTNYDPDVLGHRTFDLGVIDEACQSTEPGYWPVVLRAERLIFAGDHCQLPPTVLSTESIRQGFSVSMMERLVEKWRDVATRQLTVQYRMHQDIMQFPSEHFYNGSLIADPTVAEHTLEDFLFSPKPPMTSAPVSFVDTAGADWNEEIDPEGESKFNAQEARWVIAQIRDLLDAGIKQEDIAVIAPYSAQVRYIRDRCDFSAVEIDTVDGFQGREKEVVIISLVRSNTIGEVGFLADKRRMNVAMTRAKRKLIAIGDSSTLAQNPFFEEWIEYCQAKGFYQSIWEFGPNEADE